MDRLTQLGIEADYDLDTRLYKNRDSLYPDYPTMTGEDTFYEYMLNAQRRIDARIADGEDPEEAKAAEIKNIYNLNPRGVPEEVLHLLPKATQYSINEYNNYLPVNEAQGLTREALIEKYSQAAKRNDPHNMGFHDGDPEGLPSIPLTNSPIEARGRRFFSADQKYESKPNVFRSALPDSPILTDKYRSGRKKSGERYDQLDPAGREAPNLFPRRLAEANAYYDTVNDEVVLKRNASEKTKAHEIIHRGFNSILGEEGRRPPVELQHDYIESLFQDSAQIEDYDFLIQLLKQNTAVEEEVPENIFSRIFNK